jgi:N-sulfoglucosamine sulfohydrolase
MKRIFQTIALLLVVSTSFGKDAERYNILWLSCEDINPTIACYGTEGIETPNIDRLAKEGIRYTNAYSTVGVCAPSRSTIITGKYPVTLGTHNMRTAKHLN